MSGKLQGREVLLGVTGGISAYKIAQLASQLVQAGAGVSVVMTEAATEFIGAATFAALTGRPVRTAVFEPSAHTRGAHIELSVLAEVLCVAPATANFLGKAANGIADDLLSTIYLAFDGPVLAAPTMNTTMWEQSAVERNIAQLKEDGVTIIPPTDGWLACGRLGPGRMAEVDTIFDAIVQALKKD